MPDALSIEDLLKVGSSAGAVVLLLAILFRDQIKVWMTSRSLDRQSLVTDVTAMRAELEKHVKKEDDYWAEYDQKLGEISNRTTKLEMNNVELRVSLERDHEETVRGLQHLTESVRDLTTALLAHIHKA